MKNVNKYAFLIALLFVFTSVMTVSAKEKERFLPTSTKSEKAKELYSKAIDRLVNADREKYLQHINEAINADPDYFMANAHLVFATFDGMMEEDATKADKFIKKTLQIPESTLTDAEKIVRKIIVQIEKDPKADLTPLTEELTSSYPNYMEAWGLSRAIAQTVENDNENAFKYAAKMVELNPDFGPAHNQLGYYYLAEGKLDQAKKEFDEYLRLSPNEANAHDSMGEFYMVSGDYKNSAEHYNKAVDMGMELSRKNATKATALANGDDPSKWNEEKTVENEQKQSENDNNR